MKRPRKKFSGAFKFKVVLDALKEQQTLSELSARHDVHPHLISRWKAQFLEQGARIFEEPKKDTSHDTDTESLYQAIGQMKIENDWLKKKLGPYL